jgi:hypothetical protein
LEEQDSITNWNSSILNFQFIVLRIEY